MLASVSACFGIDDRVQFGVLDLHSFGGIVGEARGFCHHGRYRLTLVADLGDGHGIIADFAARIGTDLDERLGLGGNLLAGNRADHAGNLFGGRGIDADDLRVRVRRTHKTQIQHFAQLDVVGELAAAAQQTVLFFARQRFAYPAFSFDAHTVLPLALCRAACNPSISF